MHFYTRVFILGLATGIAIAFILSSLRTPPVITKPPNSVLTSKSYQTWFENQRLRRVPPPPGGRKTEAQHLAETVRVRCVVLVERARGAQAVAATWGRGCASLSFVHVGRPRPPAVRRRPAPTWGVLCAALLRLPEDGRGWVAVVRDSTFLIVENLRMLVAGLDASRGHYLGRTVRFWGHEYNSGETGYVLSGGALISLKNGLKNCSSDLGLMNREDYYLGRKLEELNIKPVDTRDENGLSTFHHLNFFSLFDSNFKFYTSGTYRCCSPNSIAFPVVDSDKMYTIYYLLYTVQLYKEGDSKGNREAVKLRNDEEVWKEFLLERNVSLSITSKQYYKVWEDLINDPTSFARNMKREELDYS